MRANFQFRNYLTTFCATCSTAAIAKSTDSLRLLQSYSARLLQDGGGCRPSATGCTQELISDINMQIPRKLHWMFLRSVLESAEIFSILRLLYAAHCIFLRAMPQVIWVISE